MPGWVSEGFEEYARRLPHPYRLHLLEIASGRRSKGASSVAMEKECDQIAKAISPTQHTVVLDERGTQLTTEKLSLQLGDWASLGKDINFVVGGPDGLTKECLRLAQEKWSLGPLTLPHPIVRVIVAEQLYRAWSMQRNHPYHRA